MVGLADGTTWHNSIVTGLFLSLRKEIFGFFGTVRSYKDGNWGIFNLNCACDGGLDDRAQVLTGGKLVVKTLLVVEPYLRSYPIPHTCPNVSSSITFYYWDYYTISL